MLALLKALKNSLTLNKKQGFTLIELLVVIVIMSILASLAIPSYMRYEVRARASAYAEPYARACLLDLISFCINHPGATVTDSIVQRLQNCRALGAPNQYPRTHTPENLAVIAAPDQGSNPQLSNVVISWKTTPKWDVHAINIACTEDGKLIDTGSGKQAVDVSVLLAREDGSLMLGFEYLNGTGGGTTYAECSYYTGKGIKCIITENPQDF